MANIGEANTIKRVSGNDETKRFLANLGFVPGAEVIVLSAIGGNVIVNIKDSRVAVNADMARHIMIWLRRWKSDDRKVLDEAIKTSVNIIDDYFNMNFDKLMNKYN